MEWIGTLLLMLAATGAGMTVETLFHGNQPLGLLVIAITIPCALVSLIVAFGSISGGHFNPLITGLQWLAGERRLDCTLAYIGAQFAGAVAGALLAVALFSNVPSQVHSAPPNWPLIASEIIDSAALMIVVFGCARSGRTETGPIAVGAWLFGAIVATPSTSYANPAIAFAAAFACGQIALPATTVLAYVPAEIVGAFVAFVVVTIAYPTRRMKSSANSSQSIATREFS